MTCKDCIHCEICPNKRKHHIVKNGFLFYFECEDIENICSTFKDKSKYIERPCEVGDAVYHYCKSVNQIVPYKVEDIHIDKEQTRYFATAFDVYYNEYLDEIEFTENDIGKTIFLTKFETEKKLKELKENAKTD